MDLLSKARVPDQFQPLAVFVATFALIAAVQWLVVWDDARLIDGHLWVPAIEKAVEGQLPVPSDLIYGYPGTTFLFPGAALTHWLDMGASIAYRVTMTLIPALAGAVAATLAFCLRPRTWWWVFVAWLYAFQSQVSIATPPSGILVALMPLFFLAVLYALERKRSLLTLSLTGVLGGIMLATRLESSLPVLAIATLYLGTKRFAALYIVPLIAVGLFMLLDPTLWVEGPIAHLANVFEKVLYLSGPTEYGTSDPIATLFRFGIFGLVTLGLAVLLLAARKLRSLPAGYLATLAAMTGAALVGISIAEYHPNWLYAPFLVGFQVFLPLLALDAYAALPEDGVLKRLRPEGALLRVLALLYLGLTALTFWADVARVY